MVSSVLTIDLRGKHCNLLGWELERWWCCSWPFYLFFFQKKFLQGDKPLFSLWLLEQLGSLLKPAASEGSRFFSCYFCLTVMKKEGKVWCFSGFGWWWGALSQPGSISKVLEYSNSTCPILNATRHMPPALGLKGLCMAPSKPGGEGEWKVPRLCQAEPLSINDPL